MRIDPFAEFKRRVLARLRPRPSGSWPEVAQKIRQALQEVLIRGGVPLTAAQRARIALESAGLSGAEPRRAGAPNM